MNYESKIRILKKNPKIIRQLLNFVSTNINFLSTNRLFSYFWNKHNNELAFQIEWERLFKDNKSKVLEYWRNYRYLDYINKICEIRDDSRILDVGCGISTVLHFVNGVRYGIDPLADEYKLIYPYPEGINIQKGFAEKIPFSDGYFDVVFSSNVLDHVTDPRKACDEIHRVLKLGCFFVLTVEIFEEKIDRDPSHPHCLTKNDVHLLLDGKYSIIFEKESPWIGTTSYVLGSKKYYMKYHNKELILISKK